MKSREIKIIIITLLSLPTLLLISYFLEYKLFSVFYIYLSSVFMGIHFSFLFLWLFFYRRKPVFAFAAALSGILFRFLVLFFLGFYFYIYFPQDLKPVLILYLISFFSFIFFEITALITLRRSPH